MLNDSCSSRWSCKLSFSLLLCDVSDALSRGYWLWKHLTRQGLRVFVFLCSLMRITNDFRTHGRDTCAVFQSSQPLVSPELKQNCSSSPCFFPVIAKSVVVLLYWRQCTKLCSPRNDLQQHYKQLREKLPSIKKPNLVLVVAYWCKTKLSLQKQALLVNINLFQACK